MKIIRKNKLKTKILDLLVKDREFKTQMQILLDIDEIEYEIQELKRKLK